MSRIWSVALREFLAVVKTKAFVIGLLFIPGIFLAMVYLPRLFEKFGESGERRIAVADFTGALFERLDEAAQSRFEGEELRVVLEEVDVAEARAAATGADGGAASFEQVRDALTERLAERVREGGLFGYLLLGPRVAELPPEPGTGGPVAGSDSDAPGEADVAYGAVSLTSEMIGRFVTSAIAGAVRDLRYEASQIDPALVERLHRRPEIRQFRVSTEEGEESVVATSDEREKVVPIGFMILLMVGVMSSAGILLNSTIEEKGNRVIEVLLSSVSPTQLLTGKILGGWLYGLLTIAIYAVAGLYAANHYDMIPPGGISPWKLAAWFYLFLTGHLVFASIYAGIGSLCNTVQDSQTMMLPVVMLLMLPFLTLAQIGESPDSGVAQFLSYFPFSAPFVMTMRLGLTPAPPGWQIAISLIVQALSVLVLFWAAGKVFRIAILLTGKPPGLRQVWRWLWQT